MARQLTPEAWLMIKDVAGMTYRSIGIKESELVSAMVMAWEHDHALSAAMSSGFPVVHGKPTMAPKLMWADVMGSPHFAKYEERELFDDSREFFGWSITLHRDNGQTITRSFTLDDARKAELTGNSGKMYKKYASNMCYWRAIGRACQELFPDVVAGIYTEAELAHGEWAAPEEPQPRQYTLADIMSLGVSPDLIMETNGGAIPATQEDINRVYGILSEVRECEALTAEEAEEIERAIEEDTNGTS